MDFLEPPFYKYIKLDYLTYRYPKYHNKIKTAIQLVFRTGLVLLTGKGNNNKKLICVHIKYLLNIYSVNVFYYRDLILLLINIFSYFSWISTQYSRPC